MIKNTREQSNLLKTYLLSQNGVTEAVFDMKRWPIDAEFFGKQLKKEIAGISLCGVMVGEYEFSTIVGLKHISENKFMVLELSPGRFMETIMEYENDNKWICIEQTARENIWPVMS